MAKKHEELVDDIRVEASKLGHRLWSVRPVKAYQGKMVKVMYKGKLVPALINPRFVTSQVPDGTPDLVGFIKHDNYPIFTGIEVKIGKDKMRKDQELARNMFKMHGCIHEVVYSLEEFKQKISPFGEEEA